MPPKVRPAETNRMKKPSDAQTICPMCGSVRHGQFADQKNRQGAETLCRLAHFMQDDWRACCAFLLSVKIENHSVKIPTKHKIWSSEARCEGRQKAADRFPDLVKSLGLK